jgi:nucleoid-associated protein YgaU
MPAEAPPAGPGTRIEFTKPGGTTEVRPAGVAEQPPRTSFDVDLYEPRLGDTYESIAREYYNDTRYAAALRAYNQNKPLQNSGPVEVPPIHVLRKQHPQLIGTGAAPAGRSGSGTPRAGEWAPAGGTVRSAGAVEPQPAFRSAGTSRTFTVPAGGMTLRAIARHTLGSEQRWAAIWEANPQITQADGVIPAGTVLQLPAGARVPD